MATTKPDGYVVFDTIEGKLWRTTIYGSRGAAKNSWNAGAGWRDHPYFNDQTKCVVRPVRIIDMDTGDYFT